MPRLKEKLENNNGFTLLEVLVAMIILAVMAVPFARAFATSAQTNQKARIQAQCSNAAENIAEEFRNVNVEDLIARYSTNSGNTITIEKDISIVDPFTPSGVAPKTYDHQDRYTFEIKEQDDMGSNMPDGYYAKVTLDSVYYDNANGLNLSEIAPVSIKDSAIYTMSTDLDKKAYAHFVELNEKAIGDDGKSSKYYKPDFVNESGTSAVMSPSTEAELELYNDLKYKWLRENLFRKVTLNIVKKNTVTTPSGEESIDIIEVTMKIEYELVGHDGEFFPSGKDDEKYTLVDSYLFDNSVSKQKFRGVYLFFYPRYAAGNASNAAMSCASERDRIIINNNNNVECNVYLVALSGATDEFKYKEQYRTMPYGLHVDVSEAFIDSEKAATTIRTNVADNIPYDVKDTKVGKIRFDLDYWNNNSSSLTPLKKDDAAAAYLNVQYVDGKALTGVDAAKRIYKMVVSIYDNSPVEYDETGNEKKKKPVVEFDGTKLEF